MSGLAFQEYFSEWGKLLLLFLSILKPAYSREVVEVLDLAYKVLVRVCKVPVESEVI